MINTTASLSTQFAQSVTREIERFDRFLALGLNPAHVEDRNTVYVMVHRQTQILARAMAAFVVLANDLQMGPTYGAATVRLSTLADIARQWENGTAALKARYRLWRDSAGIDCQSGCCAPVTETQTEGQAATQAACPPGRHGLPPLTNNRLQCESVEAHLGHYWVRDRVLLDCLGVTADLTAGGQL